MDSIILVHGAHFDDRIYNALKRQLAHKVRAVELPTKTIKGNSDEYYKSINLKTYAKAVCELIEEVREDSVLIAFGLGGAVINQAYGICPDQIKSMIYIGATIPFPDETPYQIFTKQDDEHYNKAINEDVENGLLEINDRYVFAEAFAQDASLEDKELIVQISKPEPLNPTKSKVNFRLSNWQSLKKLVITTSEDKIISPETQKKFIVRMKNTEVKNIESGHLPMLTHTEVLANIILEFLIKDY